MAPFTRRDLLARTSFLSLAPFPSLFSAACGADEQPSNGRVLVVLQLSGGNDGINSVVPFADEGYAKHRKELKLETDRLLPVDDQIGLHPSLRGASDLLEDGRLAIVQGVGYPSPNRSHDVSMAIWQSARFDRMEHTQYGWLGRAMDDANRTATPHMVLLGDEDPPLAIRSRRSTAVALAGLEDLKLSQAFGGLDEWVSSKVDTRRELLQFARSTAADAVRTAERVQGFAGSDSVAGAPYPTTRLGGRMQAIAGLIKSGFTTPVYYAMQGGYDTHAAQLPTHSRLLRELGDALKAFHDDLRAAGLAERVVTLCFSEFGRRVAENASMGTDHGSAGPVFIAGSPVAAGLIGLPPNLSDLERGDIKTQFDFRQVYATLLDQWLQVDSKPILGGEFAPLPIFS